MGRGPESGFSKTIKAARLSYRDLEWLSNGVLTESKLQKHADGSKLLSPAEYDLVTTILHQHRAASMGIRLLVLEKVKKERPVANPHPNQDGLLRWRAEQAAQKAGVTA